MERKIFLKQGITALGMAFVAPLAKSCSKSDAADTGSGTCTATPPETEGPFPTKNASELVRSNITGDRTGVAFTIKISVTDLSNSCAALANVIVDIWHCDKEGNYSEYGGSSMQSTNYQSATWLRGRQTTDSNGLVTFTSIFPGWYNGRATHIHAHIYSTTGKSLLVTQIAFPEGDNSAVVLVNAASGYRGMNGYTYNANDNVFSDGYAAELSSISGSLSEGFTLTHTIAVKA
ncbi:intradiol ring-cleavage dioxygenase [Niabella ginsenosidivorans]|uniref:Intradiol ring-cleavage dioxygenase n=1 Tax=Niabella ginsenosidivorans TaxID=1176587 RepID=A0A1A9I4I7_9BACT|nr:intradiol ring-cleavage dioxygenase [Niabella ginsenosidivorans]ANH81602.1 intradiol ring-cleavage dioxygenase [Niabella ginsenosidivorans]